LITVEFIGEGSDIFGEVLKFCDDDGMFIRGLLFGDGGHPCIEFNEFVDNCNDDQPAAFGAGYCFFELLQFFGVGEYLEDHFELVEDIVEGG
jgi:hypothetical protein